MNIELDKKNLRIIFMGTPEFAVASLRELVNQQYNIVGVITMPDKPAGRGHKLQQSAVKQYAQSVNLPILQPENLKNEDFIRQLHALNADLFIVVAFRMLPEVVWRMPRLGTFNLHASLLPQYRGAAPINRAIINGEKETGVTTFFLNHTIDTGAIILQRKIDIHPTDNAGIIHDKLMTIGADLVVETVDTIIANNVELKSQAQLASSENLKTAPKIFKDTCRIDWHRPAAQIYNLIRGLSPYPAAWTTICNGDDTKTLSIKIFASETVAWRHPQKPGTLHTDGKHFLDIAAADGFIRLKDIRLAGKKRMKTEDFLRGFTFSDGAYAE